MKSIGVILLIILAIGLYFLPSIIAFRRNHAYKNIIFVINLVFGLSGIGWAGSLIWAIFPSEKSLIDPVVGNVTGTGLRNAGDTLGEAGFAKSRGFENESRKTREIREAAELLQSGAISEDEFKALKRKIIDGQ
jgi:hypothetical protein